jgi:basic amino acid/polyamine antiporter, APA family
VAGSETAGGPQTATVPKQGLRRVVSRRMLVFFIVGDILGTGIYALVGEVGASVGGAIWLSFLVAVLVALITAFSYAELASKYPHAGGAAHYVQRAFGVPFVTFMVAFAVVLSGITSASAAGVAFGGDYLSEFVTLPPVGVAVAFVVVLSLVNFLGIKESVTFNVVFTIVELVGLLLILVIGVIALANGTGDPSRAMEFKQGVSPGLAVLAGAALGFFAMVGFEDSANLAEEAQNPSRDYPRALFIGVAVTGVLYVAIAFIASMVVDTGQLVSSSAPLLEVVTESGVPIPAALFSVFALTALCNSALIQLIMGSRLMYGMANQGLLPRLFARVHPGRRTPVPAIVFVALVALILVSTTDVEALAEMTAALLLAVFAMVNVAVLVLRRQRVDRQHYTAPTVMPWLGVLTSLGLLTQQDTGTLIHGGLLLLPGVALWGINHLVSRRVETVETVETEQAEDRG